MPRDDRSTGGLVINPINQQGPIHTTIAGQSLSPVLAD